MMDVSLIVTATTSGVWGGIDLEKIEGLEACAYLVDLVARSRARTNFAWHLKLRPVSPVLRKALLR